MGDVIEGDFGKPRAKKPVTQTGGMPASALGSERIAGSMADVVRGNGNTDNLRRANDLIAQQVHTRILVLQTLQKSVDHNRQIVKDYDTNDLLSRLERSSEPDWVAKPAFYKAIVLELRDRLGYTFST